MSTIASRRQSLDLDATAPFLPWPEMHAYLARNFAQGDHVAILGPTGVGKTHIAFDVAELRAHVIVVACKPRDPLIEDATKRGYHVLPGNAIEIPYVDNKPLHSRVVYWPRLSPKQAKGLRQEQLLRAEKAVQKPAVGGAIGYVRQHGHWAIVIDEGTWVCRDLNLQRDIDAALFSFRTMKSSIIILGQRPSWMGRYVLSMPTHLFLFNTPSTDDRKALGDISGADTKLIQEIVHRLDRARHECLYIDTRNGVLHRTIAPPR